MKNKFRILKILVTVILFGFLLSFSLERFNTKPLEKITVKMIATPHPVYFIDEKDIAEMVRKSNPSNKVGTLNIPELEKKLSHLPAVDSANVYLNLNGNLNLDIKQRVPAFRLSGNGKDFYVDSKGVEFPVSPNYSFACMLVTGNILKEEYQKLGELIKSIDADDFSRKYFIGISKEKGGYNLVTSDGYYKVEIGDLDRIDMKVKGFKTFVEKYLIYQQPEKYSRISVKYDNQIVTTLNPRFKENDSLINVGNKELAKLPIIEKKKEAATGQLLSSAARTTTPTKEVKSSPAVKTVKPKPKTETKPSPTKPAEKKAKPAAAANKVKKQTADKPEVKKPKAKIKVE